MQPKFKRNKSFGDTKDRREREPMVSDIVDLLELPSKKWVQVRFVGPICPYGRFWIESKGREGKPTKYPKTALSFDQDTEELDSSKKDPYRDLSEKFPKKVRFTREYYANVIVRELQEDEPAKRGKPNDAEEESGFKQKGSKLWTPVRVVRLTSTLIDHLKKIKALNRHKNKKTGQKEAYEISDPRYGVDVQIMYDKDAPTAAQAYSVQKDEKSPLTEDERSYALWDIESLLKPESLSVAKEEVERWKRANKDLLEDDSDGDDDGDDGDDDDDDDEPKSKKAGKKAKAGKAKKSKKSDDDDDDEDDDLDDEDDEPKSKKAKKSKKSDDDDDDFDDEDDEPKSKKAKKSKKSDDDDDFDDEDDEDDEPKSKSKSKKSDDDDDDDDDDFDDEDDEDDEPKSKSKSKKAKKAKKSNDDDEDDDLDDDLDDDEDEDDEPKSKKAKKAKKSRDDDDEDDDDFDDEDDEDDEPKSKKAKKSKSPKSGKRGKKSRDDDNDDDD